jgi:uncharacterized membrane protein
MEEAATLNAPTRVAALAAQERWAWAAYGLHGAGLLMLWPALFALAINFAKQGSGPEAAVDTHHRYMKRTFWIFSLVAAVIIGCMVAALVTLLINLGFDIRAITTDTSVQIKGLSMEHLWIGVVIAAGALGLLITWLWAVFRLLRGVIRLADDQPAL